MKDGMKSIKESPVIAVMRNIPEEKSLHIIEALLKGGVKNIEMTFGSTSPASTIRQAKKIFADDVFIGAGTVLKTEQVKIAVEAGAQFVFSPNFNEEVVKETLKNQIISIPGCFSPTEIYNAYNLGAHAVKVFPANVLGPQFIKDIKAPMPFIDIVPTGGINKENIALYLQAGAIAVGLGSALLDKQAIMEEDYDRITYYAKELISNSH